MPVRLENAALLAIASSVCSCSFDTSPIQASPEGGGGQLAISVSHSAGNGAVGGSASLQMLLDAGVRFALPVDAGPSHADAATSTARQPAPAGAPANTTAPQPSAAAPSAATPPPPSASGTTTPPPAAGASAPAAPTGWPSAVTGTTPPFGWPPAATTPATSPAGPPGTGTPPSAAGAGAPTPTTTAPACSTVGATVQVNATIEVAGGQTFDGHCQRYNAGSGLLASANDAHSDTPMFRLEAGARLQNVVLDASEVDGVHTYGDAELSNIFWEQIGDDALTTQAMGTVTVAGGSAAHAPNAVFQLNAAGTLRLSNFRASDAGKLVRQNTAATYRVDVFIDHCDISAMTESIFRTDSSTSTVTMTNTRYSMIAGELFLGVNPANITLMGNTEY